MPLADGGNKRIIDMVELAESFFKTPAQWMLQKNIDENEYKRESAIIQLRLFDMDNKLRELSEKVEELKNQIAEVGK